MRREFATLVLAGLLAGCASAPSGTAPRPGQAAAAPAPNLPVRPPSKAGPRPATVHMMPGLEGVIGATPAQLTRQFGAARLDVWEGDARKLQFSGTPCVLDVYLYPRAQGAEPQATYVDARSAANGQAVDRARCVAGLRRPGTGPTPAPAAPAQPSRR